MVSSIFMAASSLSGCVNRAIKRRPSPGQPGAGAGATIPPNVTPVIAPPLPIARKRAHRRLRGDVDRLLAATAVAVRTAAMA
jgi:hypothetical protein